MENNYNDNNYVLDFYRLLNIDNYQEFDNSDINNQLDVVKSKIIGSGICSGLTTEQRAKLAQ